MKISVMGMDHNELLSGKALAEMGNEIIYICKDNRRIENIKRGFYTESEEQILRGQKIKRAVDFTDDIKEALHNSNMCFISENNKQNDGALFHILSVAKDIGANMSSHTFIVDRSSLPISRSAQIKDTVQNELNKRASSLTFEVISNPDFLRS